MPQAKDVPDHNLCPYFPLEADPQFPVVTADGAKSLGLLEHLFLL